MRIAPAATAAMLAAAAVLGGCTAVVPGSATPVGASAAVGVPSTTVAPPPGLHVDELERFAIVPPPGWTADHSDPQAAVVFRAAAGDPSPAGAFTANIYVTVADDGPDLAAVVADARRRLPQELVDYRSVTDEPVVLDGDVPAHLLGGTFTFDRPLRNLQLLTVHDGLTIIVTGTAPAGTWPAHAEAIDAALRTLVVEV
ncbi:MAG TPA: hypothetical protein VM367_11980 [Pseudonocardia sp.]|nr:hypothetical protein [Pseudonocardia sp.]